MTNWIPRTTDNAECTPLPYERHDEQCIEAPATEQYERHSINNEANLAFELGNI